MEIVTEFKKVEIPDGLFGRLVEAYPDDLDVQLIIARLDDRIDEATLASIVERTEAVVGVMSSATDPAEQWTAAKAAAQWIMRHVAPEEWAEPPELVPQRQICSPAYCAGCEFSVYGYGGLDGCSRAENGKCPDKIRMLTLDWVQKPELKKYLAAAIRPFGSLTSASQQEAWEGAVEAALNEDYSSMIALLCDHDTDDPCDIRIHPGWGFVLITPNSGTEIQVSRNTDRWDLSVNLGCDGSYSRAEQILGANLGLESWRRELASKGEPVPYVAPEPREIRGFDETNSSSYTPMEARYND